MSSRPQRVMAVDWVGPDGDSVAWNNPSNWVPETPNEGDDVFFDIPGEVALIVLEGSNNNAGTLNIIDGDVRLSGPGQLNVSTDVTIGQIELQPRLEIGPGAVVKASGSYLAIGGETRLGSQEGEGSLTVGGNIFVDKAALFGGHGVVDGQFINSGVVRQNATDTLSVTGSYVQTGGTLDIELGSDSAGRLVVSETAELDGVLRLSASLAPDLGQTYEIITAAGGVSGQFEQIIVPVVPEHGFFARRTTRQFFMSTTLRGDMNLDFFVDTDDIDDFILALANPRFYEDTHQGNLGGWLGDFDGDTIVGLGDVPGFEAALRNAGVSVSIAAMLGIPEPDGWHLVAFGTVWWLGGQARKGRRNA